ncbi:MAG TPA: matrixin family metalloprotease [Anaerolineales bacterium]|nr:matrixin family metalloprotease [Anaerolineales bacterium]
MFRKILILAVPSVLLFSFSPSQEASPKPKGPDGPTGDPYVLQQMERINRQLADQGLDIALEGIEFFTIGVGRPESRMHQVGSRWVAGDVRRFADGDNITFLFDQSEGATASGLTFAQTEAAVDAALATWDGARCFRRADLLKRADLGADPDILDSFYGFGGLGDPFLADIVNAGWLPYAFFEAVGGPGGGDGILALTATFVFADEDGPTDINGDHFLDTALSETYYNDNFGDPGGSRAGNPWGIDVDLPGVDVQTVALHENGHSLELGHFGPPPVAVMNPVYGGIKVQLFSTDQAGICTVWGSWPK